jgi:hypothetical protein
MFFSPLIITVEEAPTAPTLWCQLYLMIPDSLCQNQSTHAAFKTIPACFLYLYHSFPLA